MGHTLNAFISRLGHLRRIATTLPNARVYPLGHDFALLPLAAPELRKPSDPLSPLGDPIQLPAALETWAASHSVTTPIAYVQTEYHGGTGSQAAVVWHAGRITYGPDTYDNEVDHPARALADFPINSALRHLGLRAAPGSDEFDTLSLGHRRSTEDWYAETFPPVT